jgi:hypothetical protein
MFFLSRLFFFGITSNQRWFTFSIISTRYRLAINDDLLFRIYAIIDGLLFRIYTTKTNDFQILTIFSPLHALPKRGGVMEPDPEEESNPGFRSQD